MNKAAERWRECAQKGVGGEEEEVWVGGWWGGKKAARETLANPEKWIPPLCKMTVPVLSADLTCNNAPRERCWGQKHKHTCSHTHGHSVLEQHRSKSLIIPPAWHSMLFSLIMKADKSGELLTLNYWGCESALRGSCHHPWTTFWRLSPIKGNQMSVF